MIRTTSVLISSLLMVSTAGFIAAQPAQPGPFPFPFPGPVSAPAPKGIYAIVKPYAAVNQAQAAAYPGTPPSYPNSAADTVLVKYVTTLLDNPAVSGLFADMPWSSANPGNPGPNPFHQADSAYLWNPMDDMFMAVDRWNHANPSLPPKTIQISVSAGFNSPSWVFGDIDNSVCGERMDCTGAGSCDGLFTTRPPAHPVSAKCGYNTLFFKTESNPAEQIPLPMPWNSVYKNDWQAFLSALNQRIQQEPSSAAFVSISMAGPTASSTEMSLPRQDDQNPYTCGGYLSLTETLVDQVPTCPLTLPGFDVQTAWNLLFANYYGPDPKYQNTDLPFIEEWDAAIDAYGQIFNGVTLVLTPNADPLPTFTVAASSPLLIPAPGFEPDCGNDPNTNKKANLLDAMSCAAITQILVHFTDPSVGGHNGKSTQEDGMSSHPQSIDMGNNGIKWLSAMSAGSTPLQGPPYRTSRILGGTQFGKSFSDSDADTQLEGCPDYANPTPDDCKGLTPAEALANALSIGYFPGTAVGPFFCAATDPSTYGCASTSVDFANWIFSDAPMNYMQVYDADILYASGLSKCSTLDITGRPASRGVPAQAPDVTACEALSPADAPTVQAELNLASQKMLSIAEPAPF